MTTPEPTETTDAGPATEPIPFDTGDLAAVPADEQVDADDDAPDPANDDADDDFADVEDGEVVDLTTAD